MVFHVLSSVLREFVHFFVRVLVVEDSVSDSGVEVHEGLGDDKSTEESDAHGEGLVARIVQEVVLPVWTGQDVPLTDACEGDHEENADPLEAAAHHG